MSRRNFLSVGGAAVAGSTLAMNTSAKALEARLVQTGDERIRGFNTLGRTGFQVSDLGVGGVPLRDSAVVRYAYEKGINYIDVAEGYGRGGLAEQAVGGAMQFMDRSKIFITTKIRVGNNDTVETVIDRFNQCMGRMKTNYIDAFYMHGPGSIEALSTPVFHTATDQLKADGKLKYIGFSCHGPGRGGPDSHEDIMMAGADDGRFDVVLVTFNHVTAPEWGEKVLKALSDNGVGTTAMKTSAGSLKPQPIDPENLTESQNRIVERSVSRGQSREQAIERLQGQLENQERTYQNTRPFLEKYGIQNQEQLRLASIHWAAQHPLMNTACVGMNDLDIIDKIVPLSGRPLAAVDEDMLQDYKVVLNDKYCRHGCSQCAGSCPQGLQVSTIMRYAYYFEHQGREKAAMEQYLALDDGTALNCIGCRAPCNGACPHGIDIQTTMLQAHSLLTL